VVVVPGGVVVGVVELLVVNVVVVDIVVVVVTGLLVVLENVLMVVDTGTVVEVVGLTVVRPVDLEHPTAVRAINNTVNRMLRFKFLALPIPIALMKSLLLFRICCSL
jgi:hypothetical protein